MVFTFWTDFSIFLGGVGFISVFVTFFFLLDFFCVIGEETKGIIATKATANARSHKYMKQLIKNGSKQTNGIIKKKHQLFSIWGIIAFSLNTCSMCWLVYYFETIKKTEKFEKKENKIRELGGGIELKFQLLRLFPGENVSAKVSVGACLLENGCP